MKTIRRLWFWYVDWFVGALWFVRFPLRPGEPESLATGDRAPILLIPGVYEGWKYLLAAGRRMHAAGHPVHVLRDLGLNAGRIPEAAELAERYLAEHDLTGVVVVAHSKGGLIGKYMMAVEDEEQRVSRMIAIATPFSGSSLARYSPVRTLRVFRPNGSTLSRLAANYAINSRITSIYSEFDPIIPASSHLDGATNVVVSEVGHFRILATKAVLDAVEEAIDPGVR